MLLFWSTEFSHLDASVTWLVFSEEEEILSYFLPCLLCFFKQIFIIPGIMLGPGDEQMDNKCS